MPLMRSTTNRLLCTVDILRETLMNLLTVSTIACPIFFGTPPSFFFDRPTPPWLITMPKTFHSWKDVRGPHPSQFFQ